MDAEDYKIRNHVLYHLGPNNPNAEEFATWLWKTFGKEHSLDWIKRFNALRPKWNFLAPTENFNIEDAIRSIDEMLTSREVSVQAAREMERYLNSPLTQQR